MRAMLALLIFVPLLLSGCMNQDTAFEGRVFDRDTHEPIAGAQVEATIGDRDIATTATDAEGRYKIILSPGTYTLEASAPGYEDSKVTGFVLGEDETKTQDFFLARET